MLRSPSRLFFSLIISLAMVACDGDGGVDGDAGTTETDAGTTETDAGTTETDAGTTETDAGTTETDAGSSVDAGPSETDGGSTGADAGEPTDAGAATDAGMAADAGPDTDAGSDTDAGVVTPDERSFVFRRDFRRCAAPRCGGWFVTEANAATTTCADGTTADECYVADIDWSASSYTDREQTRAEGSTAMIIDGSVRLGTVLDVSIGVFKAAEAWIAEWGTLSTSVDRARHHALGSNGISCLVAPCFNIDMDELNGGAMTTASGLDLTGTGADMSEQDAGVAAMFAGTLRATGTRVTDTEAGPGGFGETYVATQFYLPLGR